MSHLQQLDASNLDQFLKAGNRLLILSKSDCVACNAWQAEIESAITSGEYSPSIPFGKLNLDQRGLGDFKRNNTWLKDVTDLPFNVIYKDGILEKSFAGAGIQRLQNRLRRIGLDWDNPTGPTEPLESSAK